MPEPPPLARRLAAEGVGAFFLFATVIGSGIMAENLSGGNDAVALLGNTLATGAILFVLITMLGPISGRAYEPGGQPGRRARGASCAGPTPPPTSSPSSPSASSAPGRRI